MMPLRGSKDALTTEAGGSFREYPVFSFTRTHVYLLSSNIPPSPFQDTFEEICKRVDGYIWYKHSVKK